MNKVLKAHAAQVIGAIIAGAIAWGAIRFKVSYLESAVQQMQGQIRQIELTQAEQKGRVDGMRRRERERNQ